MLRSVGECWGVLGDCTKVKKYVVIELCYRNVAY